MSRDMLIRAIRVIRADVIIAIITLLQLNAALPVHVRNSVGWNGRLHG